MDKINSSMVKKTNCRNCTACFFETKSSAGVINNRIYCIHGIVDLFIGSQTNYFSDCKKYNQLFCAEILGMPLTY